MKNIWYGQGFAMHKPLNFKVKKNDANTIIIASRISDFHSTIEQ